MPTAPTSASPAPVAAVRAFVGSLIRKDASLTPWLATPLIKKRFKRGVFFPTLAKWFAELKPGYVPWPKPAKPRKAGNAKKASKAGVAAKPAKPAQKAPSKAATKGAAADGRYLVESPKGRAIVPNMALALAAVEVLLAGGAGLGDVRLSKIVPVRLGVQVLAE